LNIGYDIQKEKLEFYKYVVETVTAPDVPEEIRVDLMQVLEFDSMCYQHKFKATLLGLALHNRDKELVEYLQQKGVPLTLPGLYNPLVLEPYYDTRTKQMRDFILEMYPELETMGDETGLLVVDEHGQFIHSFDLKKFENGAFAPKFENKRKVETETEEEPVRKRKRK
jgi:hypothetical protein